MKTINFTDAHRKITGSRTDCYLAWDDLREKGLNVHRSGVAMSLTLLFGLYFVFELQELQRLSRIATGHPKADKQVV